MVDRVHHGWLRASRWRMAFGACFVTLACASCVVDHGHPPIGTATFRWSIREAFDPAECYAHGAVTMQVLVYDNRGEYVEHPSASCSAFTTTTVLNPGWYSATMQLLDVGERPVSTLLDTGTFAVVAGMDAFVDADFPPDSFY